MKIFRAFFFTVLLLALAPALAGAAEPAGGGSSASHEGVEAAKAGDWNKAIEAFKRAGDDANTRYNLALAYRQRGLAETKQQNWDGAIADFNEALKLKADDNVVRRFRAFAYMSKQDWPNALEDYNAVLKAKRADTEALERRGFVQMQLKQYDKAIADYSEAIKQQPKNVDALLGRSYVYEQTAQDGPGFGRLRSGSAYSTDKQRGHQSQETTHRRKVERAADSGKNADLDWHADSAPAHSAAQAKTGCHSGAGRQRFTALSRTHSLGGSLFNVGGATAVSQRPSRTRNRGERIPFLSFRAKSPAAP